MRQLIQIALLFIITLGISKKGFAQLSIDAEFRPRFEYRHGYKTLFPEGAEPAAFVSQRSRLNVDLKRDQFRFYMGLQDVRVWGDLPQLSEHDYTGVGLHEIWGEIKLSEQSKLRIGRQELILDDARIFGNVNWAQQARSHDLLLFNWENNGYKAKVAAAFNQQYEQLVGNDYYISNNYKTLQLIWLHKNWGKYQLSLLGFNNGMQYIDSAKGNGVRYSQTAGFHLERNTENSKLTLKSYYQFGETKYGQNIEAYLIGLNYLQNINEDFMFDLGGEMMSGNENGGIQNNVNKAFHPLYGTNHKFNGYMDYFYIGNHNNSVGLLDINASLHYAFNTASKAMLRAHEFLAQAEIDGTAYEQLGTELDFVFSHQLNREVSLAVGYSQMIQTPMLETLKGVSKTKNNNFAFISLTMKPKLLEMKLK